MPSIICVCANVNYFGFQETLRIHVLRTKIHPDASLYHCTLCSSDFQTNGTVIKKLFRTNKFSEFKAHVQREHCDNRRARNDQDIYVLAGLRKVYGHFPVVQ